MSRDEPARSTRPTATADGEARPRRSWTRGLRTAVAEVATATGLVACAAPWLWIGAVVQRGAGWVVLALLVAAVLARHRRALAGACLAVAVGVAAPWWWAAAAPRAPQPGPEQPVLRIGQVDLAAVADDERGALAAALAAHELDVLVVAGDGDISAELASIGGFAFERGGTLFAPRDAQRGDERQVVGFWRIFVRRGAGEWRSFAVPADPRAALGACRVALGDGHLTLVAAIPPPLRAASAYPASAAVSERLITTWDAASAEEALVVAVPAVWTPASAHWQAVRSGCGLRRPPGAHARAGAGWFPAPLRDAAGVIAGRGVAMSPPEVRRLPGSAGGLVVVEVALSRP